MAFGQLKFSTRHNGVIVEHLVHYEPARVLKQYCTDNRTTLIGILRPVINIEMLALANGKYMSVKIIGILFTLTQENIEFMFIDSESNVYKPSELNVHWENPDNVTILIHSHPPVTTRVT